MYSATLSTVVPLLVYHPSYVSPQTGHLACNNAPRQRNQLLIEKFADLATKLLRRYVNLDLASADPTNTDDPFRGDCERGELKELKGIFEIF